MCGLCAARCAQRTCRSRQRPPHHTCGCVFDGGCVRILFVLSRPHRQVFCSQALSITVTAVPGVIVCCRLALGVVHCLHVGAAVSLYRKQLHAPQACMGMSARARACPLSPSLSGFLLCPCCKAWQHARALAVPPVLPGARCMCFQCGPCTRLPWWVCASACHMHQADDAHCVVVAAAACTQLQFQLICVTIGVSTAAALPSAAAGAFDFMFVCVG